jgi:hypothetical protein
VRGRLVSIVADDNAGEDADLGNGNGDEDSIASTSDDEDEEAETIPQGQLDLVSDKDEEQDELLGQIYLGQNLTLT